MVLAPQGALAELYVKTGTGDPDFSTGAEQYEFLSESLSSSIAILDTNGIRGNRSAPSERAVEGVEAVGGSIILNPSVNDLANWLPRITGAAAGALGDTFSPFGVQVVRDSVLAGMTTRVVAEYQDCLVNRAIFRSGAGNLLELELELIGKKETRNNDIAAGASGMTVTANDVPFTHHDAVILLPLDNVADQTVTMFDVEIAIDNALETRFVNKQQATSICPSDRIITVNATVPYDESDAAPLKAYKPTTRGGAGNIKYTSGSVSVEFNFVDLRGPDITPNVQGKGEITLSLSYRARSTGGNQDELNIVNTTTV